MRPLLLIVLAAALAGCSTPDGTDPSPASSSSATAKGGTNFGLSLDLSLKTMFSSGEGVAVSSGEYTFYGNRLDVTVGLPPSDKK